MARLGLLPDGTALKYVYNQDDRQAKKCVNIEHAILTALGFYKRIVTCLGRYEHGLRFQLAANSGVHRYMSRQGADSNFLQRRQKWMRQAAEALAVCSL
jgi:hypothetical protein